MLEYLTLGILVVALSFMFLLFLGTLRNSHRVRADRRKVPFEPQDWPFVALIIPCKGAEPHLADRLRVHFNHDYPKYEIIFTLADPADPAIAVLRELMAANPQIATKLVIAPRLPDCVEKTSNQLAAIDATDPDVTVFAFADSDGQPLNRFWLRELVRATQAGSVATGYRWYLPETNVGRLQGAWDSAWCGFLMTLGSVWGGAMAVTRTHFEQLNLREAWSRAPTDDVVLARAAHKNGIPVTFVSGAVCLSGTHSSLWNFLMWIRRQVLLVKLPDPALYYLGVFLGLVYLLGYVFCLIQLIFPGEVMGLWLPLGGAAALALMTVLRAASRYQLAQSLIIGRKAEVRRTLFWAYYPFIPIADVLMFPIYISVLFQRAIRWRGVTYVWTGDRVRCEQIRQTVFDE